MLADAEVLMELININCAHVKATLKFSKNEVNKKRKSNWLKIPPPHSTPSVKGCCDEEEGKRVFPNPSESLSGWDDRSPFSIGRPRLTRGPYLFINCTATWPPMRISCWPENNSFQQFQFLLSPPPLFFSIHFHFLSYTHLFLFSHPLLFLFLALLPLFILALLSLLIFSSLSCA
jgi:hypothetical protein